MAVSFIALIAQSYSNGQSPNSNADTIAEAEPLDMEVAWKLYNAGRYEEAAEYASRGQKFDSWNGMWEVIKSRSLVATGQYEQALESLRSFVDDRAYELQPRLLLHQVALLNGLNDEANQHKETLGYLVNERANRYSYSPESIVAVGDIAILYEVEPKLVLENFYRRALDFASQPLSAFLGIGELALSKDDFELASKTYQEGLQTYPDSVDLFYGLARSFREDDRSKMLEYMQKALSVNPRHAPTRVLAAEHLIASEAYDAAREELEIALETNPRDFTALSLKAALALIANDKESAKSLRKTALTPWSLNPEVDYIIGKQLSLKYRFSEGASHQRRALELDETFNPARLQLAQDLLRLAQNDKAWPLVDAVHDSDPYNVSAYNLATLRDRLQDYTTLESDNFIVQLSKEEAKVYGPRVLRILEDAHKRLVERYDVKLPQKTVVEIYAEPADFETRTFGVPGNPGFLGVCFGPVFTINSPSTRSSNWEAVLYHEYCHTVTLALSNNRMPRWLSEGLSVYEEVVADPSWGMRMSADFRDRILSGRMQSLTSMSAGFLRATSGEDIQFAYYQSYLVVDFLIQKYELQAIRNLLVSLGEGEAIHDAFTRHLDPLEQLDAEFETFAMDKAKSLAPGFTFGEQRGLVASIANTIAHKKNYDEILQVGLDYLAEEDWEKAIEVLTPLAEEVGYLPGAENAHRHLALAYQNNGDIENEKRVLQNMLKRESSQLAPITRLHDISKQYGSTQERIRWANAWVAINPMARTPWRTLLQSAKEMAKTELAIESAEALLGLGAPDSATLHYTLADLYQDKNPVVAKRHIMLTLEKAPRYQKAYRLFEEIKSKIAAKKTESAIEDLDLNYDFLN